MNWSGVGPFTTQMMYEGILANYYVHPDSKTGKFVIVAIQPLNTPDTLVQDGFSNIEQAHIWLANEIRSGRLSR